MTLNLSDSELKALVKTHINSLVGVAEDRLKVTFTRRQTQTDTSVEILSENEPKSIILPATEEVAKVAQEEIQEPTQTEEESSESKYK